LRGAEDLLHGRRLLAVLESVALDRGVGEEVTDSVASDNRATIGKAKSRASGPPRTAKVDPVAGDEERAVDGGERGSLVPESPDFEIGAQELRRWNAQA
jgi:hypothetical protein